MNDTELTNNSVICNVLHVRIISLAIIHPVLLGSLPYIGPAYSRALKRIRRNYPSLNVTQTILTDDGYRTCQDLTADGASRISSTVSAKYRQKDPDSCTATVLIWGGCNEVQEIYPLARELDILMITPVSSSPDVRKKELSPTWITTTVNSFVTYRNVYLKLAEMFSWTSFGMIIDSGANPYFGSLADVVYSQLVGGRQVTRETINTLKETVHHAKTLSRLNSYTRIILYFGDPNGLRAFLITAARLNMTNGEHVYIISTPFRFSRDPGYLTWAKGDKDDEIVKQAYRSVLIIEPDGSVYGNSDGTDRFSREMKNESQMVYNYTYKPSELMTPHPASVFGSFMMVAQVMENLRTSNAYRLWSSGRETAKLFLNRSFITDTGEIFIDYVGERVPRILVNQLDWNTSGIRTVLFQNPATMQLEYVTKPQWLGDWPPGNEPKCGFRGDALQCRPTGDVGIYAGSIGGIALIIVAALLLVTGLFRRTAYERLLNDDSWRVDGRLLLDAENNKPLTNNFSGVKNQAGLVAMKYVNDEDVWVVYVTDLPGIFGSTKLFQPARPALKLLNYLRRTEHQNVNRFIGLCVLDHSSRLYFVCAFASRGSLSELTSRMTLDYDLQTALIFDLLKGVKAILQSPIRFHGSLSSRCCFIDKHFTLKIGNAGFVQLKELIVRGSSKIQPGNRDQDLRERQNDFIALGLITAHIVTLEDPCGNPDEAKLKIKEGYADSFPQKFTKLLPIIRSCTIETAAAPDIAVIMRKVTNALGWKAGRANDGRLLERIVYRLEGYTVELDHQVAVRTLALLDERNKCDLLLREMLPVTAIELLRKGIILEAETFDSATILFTEVGGFKLILDCSQPAAVLMFLNDVYTAFDSVLSRFDAYKVETIKDSYMVVSGVPVRNGSAHGKEICRLAVALLSVYSPFEVLFEETSLRAGIHTGPCAAGVVGHRAPRYCLFGDTVNTASRMLMYSHDSRIHLSESTYILLHSNFPEFTVQSRGMVDIKGKGRVATYWLSINNQTI